jgi:hypothetical protein
MADEGAREIRSMLETSSDTLADAMEKIGAGLELGDADSEVGSEAIQGVTEARSYYSRLARRIRRTRTSSDAKPDVLDALGRLNSGLALFAEGLRAGLDSDDGQERISTGADRMQEAARDLERATNALT